MYEFEAKEIKEEFKKTDYGKKVGLYILIAYIVFGVAFFISVLVTILLNQNFFDVVAAVKNMNTMDLSQLICYLSYLFVILSLTFLLYFDGKRDGAIVQFKNTKK